MTHLTRCKTQVMPPCSKPVLTPYPIPTQDPPTHSIYTCDYCLKCQCQNCSNFVKNYIFACKKSHAHLQYACIICAKFQTDCLKTLRGVDYAVLRPLTQTLPQNCLSQKCRNFVKSYFLPKEKSHANIFNMLITSILSFKLIA